MIVRNLIVTILLLVCVHSGSYQLQFDWKSNMTASDIQFCTLVWNNLTLSTLKEKNLANTIHHETFNIDFNEGQNLLNFFYFGLKGKITIDNVKITQPPKTINFLVNGDFEMPLLQGVPQYTYSDKIPGWNGYKITLAKGTTMGGEPSQGLVLNGLAKNINQRISFGRTNKYSFRSAINQEVQSMISEMLAKKNQIGNDASTLTSQIQAQMLHEFQALKHQFAAMSSSSSSSNSTHDPDFPPVPTTLGYSTAPTAPTAYAVPTSPEMPTFQAPSSPA